MITLIGFRDETIYNCRANACPSMYLFVYVYLDTDVGHFFVQRVPQNSEVFRFGDTSRKSV
jgi:hypothetical protein